MHNDIYAPLKQIISETIQTAVEKNFLDIGDFVRRMEGGFTKLGFRDETARGGVENILIIRLDAVGDFILTTPAIRAIRENFPAAHITLIVSQRIYPLAEFCPYVNEVLKFNQLNRVNILQDFINAANFATNYLWKRRFDICFCMGVVNNHARNFLSYLSGARERVTYLFDRLGKIMNNNCINPTPERFNIHDCLINLEFLKAYGLKVGSSNTEIWFDKTDLYMAKKLLGNFGDGRIKVVAGIGAAVPERKYPVEKYFVAFKEIIANGASIIILGGPSEIEDAKFLEKNLPKEFVKNLVNVGGWRVDAAIISLVDIYIGNMTGVCDISAALKKPIIVLSRVAKDIKNFCKSINEAELYYPWQTNYIMLQPARQLEECRSKRNFMGCTAGKPHCIAQIEPSEIVDAFNQNAAGINHL